MTHHHRDRQTPQSRDDDGNMKMYSLLAISRFPGKKSPQIRVCAMFPSSNDRQAAKYAEKLFANDILAFVKKGSRFYLRESTRMEVKAFGSFLSRYSKKMARDAFPYEIASMIEENAAHVMDFYAAIYNEPSLVLKTALSHKKEENPPPTRREEAKKKAKDDEKSNIEDRSGEKNKVEENRSDQGPEKSGGAHANDSTAIEIDDAAENFDNVFQKQIDLEP